MRFITRLQACFAAAIFLILYFSWLRPSDYVQDNLNRVWKGRAHRLVVFGDDWSDTGSYRVATPPKALARDRNPLQGERWTEVLCEDLNCDFIDNFARSVPSNVKIKTVGSVVDARIFANATKDARKETLMLFDFQTQVQQFIAWEKRRGELPAKLRTVDEWTVFTVFFGLWELLEFAALEKKDAIKAIDRSIEELMYNLDILADHVAGPIKVVIPRLLDVTFLPRFTSRKNESTTMYAMDQHQSVFLWTYWNMVLSQAMVGWGQGEIFMPDLHGIVMNQVRAKQLYSKQITDATGFGKQMPLFDEVEVPCLAPGMNVSTPAAAAAAAAATAAAATAGDGEMCSDPAGHLFWDDLHLSGPAHLLIGKEAARLVRGNATINSAARERALRLQSMAPGIITPTPERKNQRKADSHFDLKIPPGY